MKTVTVPIWLLYTLIAMSATFLFIAFVAGYVLFCEWLDRKRFKSKIVNNSEPETFTSNSGYYP